MCRLHGNDAGIRLNPLSAFSMGHIHFRLSHLKAALSSWCTDSLVMEIRSQRSSSREETNILIWDVWRCNCKKYSGANMLARANDICFQDKFTFPDIFRIWWSAYLKNNQDLRACRDRLDICRTRFKSKQGQDLRARDVSRTQEELCLQIIASSGSFLCSASSKLCSHFCQFDHAHSKWEQSKQLHLLGLCVRGTCAECMLVSLC